MKRPPAVKQMTAGQLVRALKRDRFVIARRSGPTSLFLHADGRRVVVQYHALGQTFPVGTLRAMLLQTQWTNADLQRLKLI